MELKEATSLDSNLGKILSERRESVQIKGLSEQDRINAAFAYARASIFYTEFICSSTNVTLPLVLEGIENLDMAIIYVGPYDALLEHVFNLEAKFKDLLFAHNKKWRASEIDIDFNSSLEADSSHGNFLPVPVLINPSMETFINQSTHPIVLKDCIEHWDALERWKDWSFFTEKFGHRLVPVEMGRSYLDDDWTMNTMPFGKLIHNICNNSTEDGTGKTLYLAQHDIFGQIPELLSDFDDPVFVELGEDIVIKNIWFGPPGTKTPLHNDPQDNIFAQVVGAKRFFFVDPKNSAKLPIKTELSSSHNTSDFDISDLNCILPYEVYVTDVSPGDLLFIPRGWWHLVIGLTPSVSISFWY